MKPISVIQKNNNCLGLTHLGRKYVVGFRHNSIAGKVLHYIDPADKMLMMKQDPKIMIEPKTKTNLTIDSKATLFIPKLQVFGKDAGELEKDLNLAYVDYTDFLTFPATHNTGIIIPYVLILEDDFEFIYRSHVIDPLSSFDNDAVNVSYNSDPE